MDVGKYLSRIGYTGPVVPSLGVLRSIQTCHLRSVPFESLTIHSNGRIQLDLPAVYDKIVNQNRGGFCYENNGLFSWLLKKLAFQVTLLSGQVKNVEVGVYGPPFDHLTLMVTLDGQRWLCDVGFGAKCFIIPLSLETSEPQAQGHQVYRIRRDGDMILEYKQEAGGVDAAWTQLFKFTLEPRRWEDFTEMCQYQQSSPSSLFYCKSFCTLLQPGGTLTYIGHRLVSTTFPTAPGDPLEITTRDLKEEEIPDVLAKKFGIVLTSPLIPKDEKIEPQAVMY